MLTLGRHGIGYTSKIGGKKNKKSKIDYSLLCK